MHSVSHMFAVLAIFGLLAVSAARPASGAMVGFNAEDYVSASGHNVVADADALGGEAVQFDAFGGRTDYELAFVTTGDYDLYARIANIDGAGLRYYVSDDFGGSLSAKVDFGIASSFTWYNVTESDSSVPVYTVSSAGFNSFAVGRYKSEKPVFDAFVFASADETYTDEQLTLAVVPEPATMTLLAVGLAAIARRRRAA